MPWGDEISLRISLIDNLARHGRWRGVGSGEHMNIQRSSSNVQRSRSAGKTNTTASGALALQIGRAGNGATRYCTRLGVRLPQVFGATRGPYIRFCETNPFHFRGVFIVSGILTETYEVCRSVCKWVRSGKTNPFSGCLMGVKGKSMKISTSLQGHRAEGKFFS